MMPTQLALPNVAVAQEIDGIEMGVLEDGSAYLTGRSLARLCGVAPSAIIRQKDEWAAGNRTGRLARMLLAAGVEGPMLCLQVRNQAQRFDAYPEVVVMTCLEYYAFEVANPSTDAVRAFRQLARAGFRAFVYHALGYDPQSRVPEPWRQFHDRVLLHSVPYGYFSVFKESTDFIIAAIRAGLTVDHRTVPDISIGKAWAEFWNESNLAADFGDRVRHDHNYPDYFPQAASNPQPIWVYPVDAIGYFRRWMQNTYIPSRFPRYLDGKVAEGTLPPSTRALLLRELAPPAALGAGGDEGDE